MDAPPALTPDRIDAMISFLAEASLRAVQKADQFVQDSTDEDTFERANRDLGLAGRNLRQSIAMKHRHDREQDGRALAARRLEAEHHRRAEDERDTAEREHRARCDTHALKVRAHFEQTLWDEYEDSDAQEMLEEIDERLFSIAHAEEFLLLPVETLIRQFELDVVRPRRKRDRSGKPSRDKIRLRAKSAVAPAPAASGSCPQPDPTVTGEAPDIDPATPPPPGEGDREAVEGASTPSAPPPDPPPEPVPEAYIPPWERLRPGQRWPGSSGY